MDFEFHPVEFTPRRCIGADPEILAEMLSGPKESGRPGYQVLGGGGQVAAASKTPLYLYIYDN